MSSDLHPDPSTGAKARGQQVVLPGKYDVFLDLDTEEAFETMSARIVDLKRMGFLLVMVSCAPSRSGLPHRHVILRANQALSETERIALQACLGSDLMRELFSLVRVWRGETATTLYEDPEWKDPR